MNKFINKRKEEKLVDTKKCKHCLSDIPVDATRCPYCTSHLD
ncbi:hypothetical protein ACFHWD_02715 [Clostridium sp. MT-14]